MKSAVSIRNGPSKLNRVMDILEEEVHLQRIGLNIMEAALIAALGRCRNLSYTELAQMLEQLDFHPQVQ